MPDLHTLSIQELRGRLLAKDCRAQEAVQDCLDQIRTTEPKIQAMLDVQEDSALKAAEELDRTGPDPEKPLWGIPLVIKDVLATKGIRTTCGSRMLEEFTPVYDAHVISRLKQAGAIILGKSNMDEFAMGSSTEHSAFVPTRNPWDVQRVPGGSSGGSAASVSAFQAPGALGTDTGGSIRQPASLCGVVGMKPTYGRVSRFGMVAFGSSLDQIGPLTRTVEDNALLLSVIAGHDPQDSTSVDRPVPDYLSKIRERKDLKGITLGVPDEFWGLGMSPEVEATCRRALEHARDLGARTVSVSLPHMPYGIAAYYIIAPAEASSNLARYDGVRYGLRDKSAENLLEMYVQSRTQGFGDEVQRRIMLGTYVLSAGYYDAYYKKAAQVRRLLRQDFDRALSKCDLLCGPASPTTAFRLGELTDDPLQMYLMDVYTIPLNLTGLPGICIPAGFGDESNMPVGLQFLGRSFQETQIYQAAHVLHSSLPGMDYPRGLVD